VVAVIAATVEIATGAVAAASVVVTVVVTVAGAASVLVALRVLVARHDPVGRVDRLHLALGGHGQALRVRDRVHRGRHAHKRLRR
jgi:hypothetical protein